MRYYIDNHKAPRVFKVQDNVIVWQSRQLKNVDEASKLIDSLKLEQRLGIK